jgi:hypothetical protein
MPQQLFKNNKKYCSGEIKTYTYYGTILGKWSGSSSKG